MPNCRNCGSRLSRFNNDICPICGCKHPFQGNPSETLDITQEIKSVDPKEFDSYQRKSKKVSFWLSIFLGWSGAPLYYLKYSKQGVIYSFVMLLINAIIFTLLFLFANLQVWICVLVPILIYIVSDFILGFVLYKPDMKDGRGEYLN